MRISVIIPTYNRARLLGEALESVFGQEEPAFEILVVDDGSTDETVELLRSHGDRVRMLRQENRGPAAARNLGIEHARGDYVAFLDSDDVWFPWTLAVYRSVIERHHLPSLIEAAHVEFDTADGVPALARSEVREEASRDYLSSTRGGLWPSGTVIRTDALRSVGGFIGHSFNAEDCDLWMRLGVQPGFVHVLAPPVFAYRRHPDSAVGSFQNSCKGILAMIEREHQGGYPGGEERKADRLRILTTHTRPLSVACARRGLSREAWEIYVRTFRWNLKLGRSRYLVALPCLALWHSLFRRRACPV
jgi:glycosyltransferase involved in cell wall biosynthesis